MNLKLIAAIVLSGLVAAACWWSYQAGQNQNELQCQATLTDLGAQSAESKKQSVEVVRNEETIRVSQAQTESARVQDIQRRREAARRVQSVDPPNNRVCDCRLSDVRIGLLREATSNPALPETGDTSRTADAKDPAL